jgi:hypothetical protein
MPTLEEQLRAQAHRVRRAKSVRLQTKLDAAKRSRPAPPDNYGSPVPPSLESALKERAQEVMPRVHDLLRLRAVQKAMTPGTIDAARQPPRYTPSGPVRPYSAVSGGEGDDVPRASAKHTRMVADAIDAAVAAEEAQLLASLPAGPAAPVRPKKPLKKP